MRAREKCPTCGVDAYYDPYSDWFRHADGSDDRACICAVARGEVELHERPDLVAKDPAFRPAPATTDLYRYFDADGRLLYIGISLHAAKRAAEHRAGKDWWNDVATMTIEKFATREAALEAERVAIIAEGPLHNVVHNRDREAGKALVAAAMERVPTSGRPEYPWMTDGMVGWFVHTYDSDGTLHYQGEVAFQVTDDSYMIQWFEFLMGEPSDCTIHHVSEMGHWKFYPKLEWWKEAYERYSRQSRSQREDVKVQTGEQFVFGGAP